MHPQLELKKPKQLHILLRNPDSGKTEALYVVPINAYD